MAAEAARAKWGRLHDERKWHDGSFANWESEPSASHPFRFDMGVTIGVVDTDSRPHDKFLTVESTPFPPPNPEPEEDRSGDSP